MLFHLEVLDIFYSPPLLLLQKKKKKKKKLVPLHLVHFHDTADDR
jgi:hypothetical protein